MSTNHENYRKLFPEAESISQFDVFLHHLFIENTAERKEFGQLPFSSAEEYYNSCKTFVDELFEAELQDNS